jgi:diamine N-acetyltransferase
VSSTLAARAVLIRHAVIGDAEALAAFAARVFAEAYGDATGADDLQAHLAATYRPDLQARELADPACVTLLALLEERIVAYAQVRRNPLAPDCVARPDAIELQRFYAERAVHGTGLAAQLLRSALDAAVELGGRYAWLGVWERNARALAFYRKAGFVAVGLTQYVVGTDRQTDHVLLASLAPPGTPESAQWRERLRTEPA